MANDRRGSRLLSDLNNAFRRDPEIDEYDILPVTEPKHNRSPVVLVDHKLGLEMWSVKILYQYAYHKLLAWRSKEPDSRFMEAQDLIKLSRAVVLVNPECYTVWNIRKELVDSGDLTLQEDLKLAALVLTKHPKSSETFSHRKWLLTKYVDCYLSSSSESTGSNGSLGNSLLDGFISMEAIDVNLEANQNGAMENGHNDLHLQPINEYHEQMRREFTVCRNAAEKYACNYYAWSYRIWLVQHCHNSAIQVLLSELQSTETWVSKHVSDHSGFHYRQFLLSSLQKQASCLKDQYSVLYANLVQKESHLITDLVHAFPGHEALWSHRKFVFRNLFHLFGLCSSTSPTIKENITEAGDLAPNPNNSLKKTRLENDWKILEMKEIDSVSKKELKSRNSYQRKLAQNYLDWIQKALTS